MATPVKEYSQKDFPVCPQGPQRIVCGDVIKRPQVRDQFGVKDKVDILFFSEKLDDKGEMHSFIRRFTDTLSEKGELRKFLRAWRGHDLLPAEFHSGPGGRYFDLDKVIGLTGYANVGHIVKPHKTYAVAQTIMPLPPGQPPLEVPSNYVRLQNRDAKKLLEEAFPEGE